MSQLEENRGDRHNQEDNLKDDNYEVPGIRVQEHFHELQASPHM